MINFDNGTAKYILLVYEISATYYLVKFLEPKRTGPLDTKVLLRLCLCNLNPGMVLIKMERILLRILVMNVLRNKIKSFGYFTFGP